MTYDDLRNHIAGMIGNAQSPDGIDMHIDTLQARNLGDAVIRTVIEYLAGEADRKAATEYYYFGYEDVPEWIRSYLPDDPP